MRYRDFLEETLIMKRKIFVITFALSIGTSCATLALADVFRCVAPEGDVTYSDSQCDDNTILSANLTETVRTCDTAECEAALQQSREQSIARLREERAALSQMQEMRLRAEAHDLDRRLRLAQLERLQALDDRPADVGGGVWWPAYPLYPGADIDQRPCHGANCYKPGIGGGKPGAGGGKPHPRPHKQGGTSFRP